MAWFGRGARRGGRRFAAWGHRVLNGPLVRQTRRNRRVWDEAILSCALRLGGTSMA